MAYTDIDDPSAYFQTTLYTGNGSNNLSITNSGNSDLQPDWVWIKQRDSRDHFLFDSVRGVLQYVASNTDAAESTLSDGLKSFNSNGFTIDDGVGINQNNDPHVSWNWKAGTSFTNDASSTGIGTIDSTGSVSDTAGFSIVSYTGTGSNGTIKHGLSTVPKIMIVKERDNANNWFVYHYSLGATKQLILQETDAEASFTATWNDTEPTSSVFSVGTSNGTNRSGGGLIAYCFAEKKGYSKFGSYTGNGNADGTFVYTGFKPAWLMVKPVDAADNWVMFDNKRLGFNSSTSPYNFYANKNFTETTDTGELDFTAQGFKIRNSGNTVNRTSTFIYMAFAENPFVTSTGVPATAR